MAFVKVDLVLTSPYSRRGSGNGKEMGILPANTIHLRRNTEVSRISPTHTGHKPCVSHTLVNECLYWDVAVAGL